MNLNRRVFSTGVLTSIFLGKSINIATANPVKPVTNADLLIEIRKSKLSGNLTPELKMMIREFVLQLAVEPKWKTCSPKHIMIGKAIYHCQKHILVFRRDKSDRAYAFIHAISTGAFCGVVNRYKMLDKLILRQDTTTDPRDPARLRCIRKSIIAIEEHARIGLANA